MKPTTAEISPFFIVSDVERTTAFYRDMLGFETTFQEPARSPFFAIVRRDGAQLLVKSDASVTPLRNAARHPYMRWDAYVYAPDPDALSAEFVGRGAALSTPLANTHEGLRGFEVTDPDGYVLFFGRPRDAAPD
ncbi:MAG TPA: VOC family protein [Candidatus Sulfotelmatobacter sp.]|nr:VOC family protein [Candidatus Sulfotelmatobacter sp.]